MLPTHLFPTPLPRRKSTLYGAELSCCKEAAAALYKIATPHPVLIPLLCSRFVELVFHT